MDLSEPARALAPGLTVPVLRALSRRSTPAIASQLWRAAGCGTLAGIQRACDRLVEHGVVEAHEAAGRVVYALNRDHLLYASAMALLAHDGELRSRLSSALREWEVEPVAAVLYGSAARGDGGVGSDIDLLLVRPPLRTRATAAWLGQVDRLRHDVRRWTGNALRVVDPTAAQVRTLARDGDPIVGFWLADGVSLHGPSLGAILGGAAREVTA